MRATENEINEVMKRFDSKSIFLGPRIQWAYATHGLKSPINEPVWWHSGVSYARERETEYINLWKNNHHDLVILASNDTTNLPQALTDFVGENYERIDSYKTLTVFKLHSLKEVSGESH